MTGLDEMRIGDTERDAVTAALHEHFAAGRLDREELDERLAAALAAKTRGDLKAVVRDLPEPNGLASPEPSRAWGHHPPVPWHPHAEHHAAWGRRAWAHGHPALRHGRAMRRHGHRHGPFPVFPLLAGVFIAVAVTVGPGAATLAVLHLALLVWTVRAIVLAVAAHRARTR